MLMLTVIEQNRLVESFKGNTRQVNSVSDDVSTMPAAQWEIRHLRVEGPGQMLTDHRMKRESGAK